jgi:hypothetical protein
MVQWDEEKQEFKRLGKRTVVLKELNNSKNIESKELNEVQYLISYVIYKWLS